MSRSTLRLTFKSSEQGVELVGVERLPMITPPQPGERPVAGKSAGHWLELQDQRGELLAHRVLSPTLLHSVEVHSPDGKIRRTFGGTRSGVFEVLLPDHADAKSAVLFGNPPKFEKALGKRAEASAEIARFDLPSGRKGD